VQSTEETNCKSQRKREIHAISQITAEGSPADFNTAAYNSRPLMSPDQAVEMQQKKELVASASALFAGTFHGVLSTQTREFAGYPFGSVTPYCLDRAGRPLLLVSHLAQHTQNMVQDPKCSLTVSEEKPGDVQQRMRLTLLCNACPLDPGEDELPTRYLRYFPESRDYYEQLNFRFYRLLPQRFYIVGGFGAARWIDRGQMAGAEPFSAPEEEEAIARLHSFHDHFPKLLSEHYPKVSEGDREIAIAGVDRAGMDLRQGAELYRIPFPKPLSQTTEITNVFP
jgi:putative heme iron utilization protein